MEFKYSIELMRFKNSGKFYDTVTFGTNSDQVWQVAGEVKNAFFKNVISQDFDYLITGVGFPDTGYPHLLKLNSCGG